MKNLPEVEVVVEVPRGSFLKRNARGKIEYLSPVPCPFNYGSVPARIGSDGDPLDAVVLGRRLCRGTRLQVPAIGAIQMFDHGEPDHKLVCSSRPVGKRMRAWILLFFRFYAKCKGLINFCHGRSGANRCAGWMSAAEAIENAAASRPGDADPSSR
jgi:inorganic pyrophosphatase